MSGVVFLKIGLMQAREFLLFMGEGILNDND